MVPCVGHDSQREAFPVTVTNMLVAKKPQGPNASPNRPNANSNASQWNVVCAGHIHVGFALANCNVDFMLFVSFCFIPNTKAVSGEKCSGEIGSCIFRVALGD